MGLRSFQLHLFMLQAWLLPLDTIAQLPAVSFNHLKRDQELFSSNYCALAEDNYGFIWFGSNDGGGLYRFDGYDIRFFLPEATRLETTVSGTRINTVCPMSDSAIWIGTTFGFTEMNPVSGALRNFNNHLDDMPDFRYGNVVTFIDDRQRQTIWIGARIGLMRLDPGDTQPALVQQAKGATNPSSTPEDLTALAMDSADNDLLWLSTYEGLYRYAISTGIYKAYALPPGVGKLTTTSFYQDRNGKLWLATREGFIHILDKQTGRWQTIQIPVVDSTYSGRPEVYRIFPGADDDLWISTHTGVGKLDLMTHHFDAWHYEPEHPEGLLQNETYRDLFADRHGRLWVSSWHGVQYAKQAFMQPSGQVDKLCAAITDVQVSPGYDDDPEALIYTGTLYLRKDQRDITFQYVLPNPLDPANVSYRYILRGYDNDWIVTDQRKIRYPRLGGGQYVFAVQAKEKAQAEWLPVTELTVEIPRKLTEMWWFWIFVISCIGVITILTYRALISRARKEERLKSEFESKLSEIEMQALRAQMNPHFLFNSLNSIKYYAISKSKDETATYLSKFAMLVRAILNNSKSRTISLKDELDALQLYIEIEHMRLEGKFDYLIDIDKGIHINQAQIPPMILQPYVENAIWHGLMHKQDRGRLLVQVKDLGNQIQCIIEDNGIGRAKAAEMKKAQMDHKKSVGMQITSDRIALINKIYQIDTRVNVLDLTDDQGQPTGTRVVINIPLIRDEEE